MRLSRLTCALACLTLGVLFGLRVFDLNVRTLIPLAGLMVGNSLAATVLVGRRLVETQIPAALITPPRVPRVYWNG